MRRLPVGQAQLHSCVANSVFALHPKRNPNPGEILLLELLRGDALRQNSLARRINYALVFDYMVEDDDWVLNRRFWPTARKNWRWILFCSATIPTVPFSLENLSLSKPYTAQEPCCIILPQDEEVILPYIQFAKATRRV